MVVLTLSPGLPRPGEGAGRVELLWQPTAQFQAYFFAEYNYIDQGGYPAARALYEQSLAIAREFARA